MVNVCKCFACMYLCTKSTQRQKESEEGDISHRTRVTDPCELSCGHGNLIPGSEETALVTAEPSLQLSIQPRPTNYLGMVLDRVIWDILHQSPVETIIHRNAHETLSFIPRYLKAEGN